MEDLGINLGFKFERLASTNYVCSWCYIAAERNHSTCSDDLDPRVEGELENLNKASNDINILEKELDEARAVFRQRLTDAARSLKALAKSLGNSIDKSRPYFEALRFVFGFPFFVLVEVTYYCFCLQIFSFVFGLLILSQSKIEQLQLIRFKPLALFCLI